MDKLVEGVSCFLLGGRAWIVEQVRHSERTVVASPAPAGRKPSWGGFVPQFLSFEVCRKMGEILTTNIPLPYLDELSRHSLEELRADLGRMLRSSIYGHEQSADGELLWTFAGGAINQTLKYGFQILRGWSVVADNFRLRFPSDCVTHAQVAEGLAELGRRSFWEDENTQERLLEIVPEYRLSKFQPALPRKWSLEMIRDYLVDIEGTVRYLGNPRSPAGSDRL
ncbi:MAG: hypothetical protein HY319_26320 [Armatimonadetes bacterium]|nr:hypothetical protein [Armatimonadota bacterium]